MKYEYMLEESKALWNEFTNGTKPQEPPMAPPYAALATNTQASLNNSRTNPIGN